MNLDYESVPRDLLEFVNPSKLCVALWLREYAGSLLQCCVTEDRRMTARQRRNVCLLALKLLQNVDLPLSELIVVLKNSELPHFLFPDWKKNLVVMINEGGVCGLMDLIEGLEKLLDVDPHHPQVRKSSVVGIFLRRLLLGFKKLSFSEVSNLYQNLVSYYKEGLSTLQDPHEDLGERIELEYSLFSAEVASINRNLSNARTSAALDHLEMNDCDRSMSLDELSYEQQQQQHRLLMPAFTRKQSELYISRQVELLATSEINADNAETIAKNVSKILECNPTLTEAYFLSYLNCLRLNDYPGALDQLLMFKDFMCDDTNRSFRFSSLNLAALHARFGHEEKAMGALKEAMMMAQEAYDHVCLQHALSWLHRLSMRNRKMLIEKCVSKSNEYKLHYLTSLSIQTLAHFVSQKGGKPSDVMKLVVMSDLINSQNSYTELTASSFSLKSALWSLYGHGQMSCQVAQLMMINIAQPQRNLGQASDGQQPYLTENSAIAMATVARYLNDQARLKDCDSVLRFATKMCPVRAKWASVLYKADLQIRFERAVLQADWGLAERLIRDIMSFMCSESDQVEQLLLQYQLHLCRGDAAQAAEVSQKLNNFGSGLTPAGSRLRPHQPVSAVHMVRICLMDAELACLGRDFAFAIVPLTKAGQMCTDHKLYFMKALVTLSTAHIQLQFGMPDRAVELLHECFPVILSHGSVFERSRARLLLAKCLIASASAQPSSSGFKSIQAVHRSKDVIYLMALVYNAMDLVSERNQAAADFKKLCQNNPVHMISPVAHVL